MRTAPWKRAGQPGEWRMATNGKPWLISHDNAGSLRSVARSASNRRLAQDAGYKGMCIICPEALLDAADEIDFLRSALAERDSHILDLTEVTW